MPRKKATSYFDGDSDYEIANEYASTATRQILFCRVMRHTANPATWPSHSEVDVNGGWIHSGQCIGCGGTIHKSFHPNSRPNRTWITYPDGYLAEGTGRALQSKAGRAALNNAFYNG